MFFSSRNPQKLDIWDSLRGSLPKAENALLFDIRLRSALLKFGASRLKSFTHSDKSLQ
jgi:hypothetical protein